LQQSEQLEPSELELVVMMMQLEQSELELAVMMMHLQLAAAVEACKYS
jgi:hypothetical protein